MLRLVRVFTAFIVVVATASAASAQFGHPLKGTWSGDWGTGPDNRTHVLVEFNWDGKAISGAINPGANGVPLKVATLDPSTWSVHFEGDGKDGHIVADGKIENIGAFARFITGTWTEGSKKGTFKVTRN